MATHSSVLAWRIPGMGEPGGLPSMGSHRVEHDWSDLAAAAACLAWSIGLCLVGTLPFSSFPICSRWIISLSFFQICQTSKSFYLHFPLPGHFFPQISALLTLSLHSVLSSKAISAESSSKLNKDPHSPPCCLILYSLISSWPLSLSLMNKEGKLLLRYRLGEEESLTFFF